MTAIIPWQPDQACDAVIRHLAEGKRVLLPTESTYELVGSALHAEAVAETTTPFSAIVLNDYPELFDWLPLFRGGGVRLYRKLGPGPVTLRADAGYRTGLWSRLPAPAQRLVARDGLLAVRWPAHPIWEEIRRAGLPLIAQPLAAATANAAIELAGAAAACVVDAGPTQYGELPTVIRVAGRRCLADVPGILAQDAVDELTLCRALFVCTGNTCRSPLAEALCAKLLADHCGCTSAELKEHGFLVQSCGLAAMTGSQASPDAVVVAADLGADLSRHRSQMVTMEMLLWADHLYTMTAGHCYTLESILAEGTVTPKLLSPDFDDIADPIGSERAAYRTCAHQILSCLRVRLPEILES